MRKIYLLAFGISMLFGNSFAQDTSSNGSCDAPNNLKVQKYDVDPCILLVEWTPPDVITPQFVTWMNWDDGSNFMGIGLQGGGTFTAAIRFTPQQISEFNGATLSRIRIFLSEPGGTIVLMVWTEPNAFQIERIQPISAYTPGQWNEFVLDDPMQIDASTELWIGYQITLSANQNIAGLDSGPALAGYGDMLLVAGGAWESLAINYGFNYNWNIRGGVTVIGSDMELKRSEPVAGYNLFRDDTLIAYTSSIEYIDDITNHPEPSYKVTAVYQDCESDYSQTVFYPVNCTTVAVNNLDLVDFDIYPNPASDKVTVNYKNNISKLTLIDMMGRKLAEYPLTPGSTSTTLDLTNFPEGVYLLRFETADKRRYGKKLVMKNSY